jgi:hypothetical protein
LESKTPAVGAQIGARGNIFGFGGFRLSPGDWILDDTCGGRSDRTRCPSVAKAAEALAARAE